MSFYTATGAPLLVMVLLEMFVLITFAVEAWKTAAMVILSGGALLHLFFAKGFE